jgi:hypothetical protein
MSIKFVCSCGKRLRARDEMAARRSMCPRCGAPVGIPSLRPTHAGTAAAPMTPQERRRLRRDKPHAEDAFACAPDAAFPPNPSIQLSAALPAGGASDTVADRQLARRLRRIRHLEAHWYQCASYPFFCMRSLLALTLALTLLSGCIVLLIPELPRLAALAREQWLLYALCFLGPVVVVAYACGSVECALTTALAGQGCGAYYSVRQIGLALKSGFRWLLCFLAGPVVLIVLAAYYWLNAGDLTGLDWLILGELGMLAFAYWLLSVVAITESNRFRDANPVAVLRLIDRLGFRAAVPVLLAPAVLLADLYAGFAALMQFHRHTSIGFFLLACCWGSALFFVTFLFRLLGVWCYRSPASTPKREAFADVKAR